MKQTNNAIKFLLAQYRAIFKQAYLKGLVSAAVLTAGLAAGATANATALTNASDLNTSDTIYIDGSGDGTNGKYSAITITTGAASSFDGLLVIQSGDTSSTANYLSGSSTGNSNTAIKGTGTLRIDAKTATDGLVVSAADSGNATIDIGTIDIKAGTLKLTDADNKEGVVTVAADQITVNGSKSKIELISADTTTDAEKIVLGRESDDDQKGSIITVTGKGASLEMSSDASGAVVVRGDSLTISNGAVMLTKKGVKNTVATDNFTVDKNSFKIISGSAAVTETFEGHQGEVYGNVLVAASGTWAINARHDEGQEEFEGNVDDDGNYQSGTDDIVGNVTFKSGSNIQIGDSGAITVNKGTLTIEDGVSLNAIDATNDVPVISLNASNDTTDEKATLEISSKTLKSFLSAGDKYNKIDSSNNTLEATKSADVAGSVMLASGSLLKLTDTTQVDLSKTFTFFSGNAASSGDIVIDTNKTSTIYGQNIAVSDLLKSGDGSQTSAFKLNVEADTLTLGSSKFDSATKQFNVESFEAHDSINFQSSGNVFTLQNTVNMNRADDDSVGKITGDALQIGNGTSGGVLSVTGGTFETTGQNITLVSGSTSGVALQVTSDSGDDTTTAANGVEYYTNPVDSYLTINGGKFILSGSAAADAVVEVKGVKAADATLDLTKTSVTWGNGTVTVSGTLDKIDSNGTKAGYGTVKITGDQFKNFIASSSKTKLSLNGNGILDITGSVTGDIEFSKFADNTPAAGVVSFDGGILQTNGELSLVAQSQGAALDIGNGKISAQAITISDKNIAAADKGTANDIVKVDDGTLQVQKRLSSANKTIVFGDGNEAAELKLTAADTSDTGTVANDLNFNARSSLYVERGNWVMDDKDITLDGANLQVRQSTLDTGSSLTADNLAVKAAYVPDASSNPSGEEELIVAPFSSATFNTIQSATGNDFLIGNGTLTILGRGDIDTSADSEELQSVQDAADTAGVDLTGTAITVSGSNAKLEFGNTATSKLVTIAATSDPVDGYIKVADELGEVTLESGAQLRLNFTSDAVFTAEMAKELKEEAVVTLNNGFINIGSGSLSIKYDVDNETAPETSWDNVKDFVQIESDVANDKLLKTLITDIDAGDVVSGHYGALQTNFDGNTSVQVDGRLTLHTARDGYFVSNKGTSGRTAVGVSLQADSYFATYGAGKLGAISSTANNADVTFTTESGSAQGPVEVQGAITGIDDLTVDNDAIVAGNITANYLDLSKSLSNDKFDSKFKSMAMLQGSSFTTNNLTLTGEDVDNIAPNSESLVAGDLKVTNDLTIKAAGTGKTNTLTIAGGTVYANGLILNSGAALVASYEGIEVDSDPDNGFDETQSYTGRFSFAYADLNDGGIILDPLSTLPTSVGSISTFADGKSFKAEDLKAGTVNGKLFVGMNSALGIGTADDKAVDEAIAKYQSNGALSQYGALVVVDKAFTLDTGDGLTMTAQSVSDFEKYMENKPFTVNSQYHTIANTVYFGEDTAMIINADALNKAADRGEALVTFTDNNAQLIADGGEIILSGDVRARRTYTFFKDGDGKVSVVDINGKTDSGAAIQINTENGFLFGEINNDNGGTLTLQVNTDRAILGGASDPVYASLVAYAQGYNGDNEEDKLFYGYTKNEDGSETPNYLAYDNYFLNEAISYGNGADAEKAARLAVYGGATQAALTAGATTYEAVNSRMGMGAQTGSVTFADNGQGAGLWVTPIYKSHDSDDFEAQGLSYGADMDLYGVALGGDYTLDNGLRVGAAFNVGSGDADGQGAGNGVSNDFDYYGFTVYGGYTWDKLSIVADVSYTSVDNDVEANTQFEKISASMDSTSLSFGVTGQYTFDISGMNVTPHAGMRFTNIDMDDYTVKGVEEIAKYNGDSANIFSIPVGVTVSKEFVSGAWTVKPAFDLTLTANVGDDSVDGSVTWAGVDNLKTNLESEIIDSFTYGATLGVSAKTGNFTMGLGVNYTGASSADEYGVSANARFVF